MIKSTKLSRSIQFEITTLQKFILTSHCNLLFGIIFPLFSGINNSLHCSPTI
nr:MAG TPA: hypothetical protein [Bacteriophage sp.]